ncbi:hypothetical protein BDV28DRAFT_161263 [Aspergillus coremiiformis]|uniref:Uncharacterized protein n=1 Tax=Aspergillus coremiiformis TaxID=138285 RepID=A0A5N6YVX3_9EURO|nr:hypothetical protein BDV28DRAFT_161263 [Aspergillus coremiiformis]
MARPLDFSSKITGIIHGVFESVMDRNAQTLDESCHAPLQEDKKDPMVVTSCSSMPSATGYVTPPVSHSYAHSPLSTTHPPSTHSFSQNKSSPSSTGETMSVNRMYPVADVDDAAGFMAAARALKLDPNAYRKASSGVAEDASSEHGSHMSRDGFPGNPALAPADDFVLTSTPKEANTPSEFQVKRNGDFGGSDSDNFLPDVIAGPMPPKVAEESNPSEFASIENSAIASRISVQGEQSREHLTTFESWGTPDVRDKPAARIRQIIIKGLPSTWCTPAKVLSLIHGGTIESVFVTPAGTAHILFCEHEACKAFYDKYPNGIDLDRERKVTIFVEMGKDVDVVSSQLSFSLSTGATRAVRAIGVDLDVTMRRLSDTATGSNRKVEKILDTYVPGDARSVVFRFCSIDDAVRFRAMLVRNEHWEQCNIQYAADPCELATGYHTD